MCFTIEFQPHRGAIAFIALFAFIDFLTVVNGAVRFSEIAQCAHRKEKHPFLYVFNFSNGGSDIVKACEVDEVKAVAKECGGLNCCCLHGNWRNMQRKLSGLTVMIKAIGSAGGKYYHSSVLSIPT